MKKSTIPFALVVDDDPFILMNIADILSEVGFRCHEAEDGDAAIKLLATHAEPDLGDMPPKATFIAKPFDSNIVRGHLREKLPDGKKPEQLKNAV